MGLKETGRRTQGGKAESMVTDASAGYIMVVRKGSSSAVTVSFFPLNSEGLGSRALCSLE